jgi:hypothetical protein
MANLSNSVLEIITNSNMIDSRIRNIAAMCVKRYFKELITKNKIADISDDDIEELAFEVIDELATEDYLTAAN